MTYVWLFLAVGIVVVAVLVALGAGSSASDASPDRRAADLPADRPVEASDIDALRLPQALRGYRMDDVDDVLDRLARELTERDDVIDRLRQGQAGHPS
ncbi:MAG: DivIVA domain-containing protein [Actinomycetes bacterium]